MHMPYDTFETFYSSQNIIIDFRNEFEWLYNKVPQYDIELPNGVLAYHVLKNANISYEKHLVWAMLTSLTYQNIKKATEGQI